MGKREGINYTNFKDQFAATDFDADQIPVLSLFPLPSLRKLEEWEALLTGLGAASGYRLVCVLHWSKKFSREDILV